MLFFCAFQSWPMASNNTDFYVLGIKLFAYSSSFNPYNHHMRYQYSFFMDMVTEAWGG